MTAPQTIFVAGGAGFIGRELCRRLSDGGHAIIVFDKRSPDQALPNGARFIQGDIRDSAVLTAAMQGASTIYNLAAEHQDNVTPLSLYAEVNVDGAANICKAAQANDVRRIIFTSSVAVYGAQTHAMDEATPHRPFNEYGRTKHLAEIEYRAWLAGDEARQLTIVRPTVVFGPGNRGNVYNFLRQMKRGPFVMFGDGKNVKSMAHVSNIASFLCFLADRPEREGVYNYADKPDFSMRDLVSFVDGALERPSSGRIALPKSAGLVLGQCADIASRAIGRPLPVSRIRVEKFCAPSEIDAGRAFALGFTPPTRIEDGLREMARDHI